MQRKQYNCFFNNCEVVSNYVGHLGGGGGEGARPLHPSPRSALLIEQGRTVATVHLAKQECLFTTFLFAEILEWVPLHPLPGLVHSVHHILFIL